MSSTTQSDAAAFFIELAQQVYCAHGFGHGQDGMDHRTDLRQVLEHVQLVHISENIVNIIFENDDLGQFGINKFAAWPVRAILLMSSASISLRGMRQPLIFTCTRLSAFSNSSVFSSWSSPICCWLWRMKYSTSTRAKELFSFRDAHVEQVFQDPFGNGLQHIPNDVQRFGKHGNRQGKKSRSKASGAERKMLRGMKKPKNRISRVATSDFHQQDHHASYCTISVFGEYHAPRGNPASRPPACCKQQC